MPSRKPPSHTSDPLASEPGTLGEELVARWLQRQGYRILERRWQCRWGELDLVIGQPCASDQAIATLAFVEVKTRSRGNWDQTGALSITPQKQAKLWKTAQLFLTHHPQWETLPCQFDVALVSCQRVIGATITANHPADDTQLIQAGYRLSLYDYISAAFTQ